MSTVKEQILKMPRGEFNMLVNSRNDEQSDAIRAAWIAWIDTQKDTPKSTREAWYGFQAYRKSLPPGAQI